MNIFNVFKRKKQQEIRADTNSTESVSVLDLSELLGITGELKRESAIQIPTVAACIGKIADTVSRLPIKLYRKNNGEVEEITDDIRLKLLNQETGDTLSTVDMWKSAVEDYFLGGGAWIYINSNGIRPVSLHYVSDKDISFMANNDPIFKSFKVLVGGNVYYDFQFIRILRKTRNGYTNIPIQQDSQKALSAAYNALMLENMMNSNGGCKSGFLKSKNRLSEAAVNSIKDGYERIYGTDSKSSKMVVLNEGIEFQEISSTAAELQLNENKKTNSVEICKIFGFPHTVIDGGMSASDEKQFVAAVVALLNQIEAALDMYLLLESEKNQGYYFAFDTKELTRGSQLERYQAYEIALRNRFLQVDEVRKEEDYDPMGFNFVTLGLGDILYDIDKKQVFTPNTGQITELGKGSEINEN